MPWDLILSVLIAFIVTGCAGVGMRVIAVRGGFTDQPGREAHKQHVQAVPYGGGIIVALGMGAALIGAEWYSSTTNETHTSLWPLLIGAGVLLLIGLIDDRYPLRAGTKFVCQALVAAVVVPTSDLGIDCLRSYPVLFYGLSWAWLVLISNAYNLMDHADGLCGTLATISAIVLTIGAVLSHDASQAVLFAALAGSLLGFLLWNAPPARMYLGDAGSLPIGFLIGAGTLGVTFWPSAEGGSSLAILSPLLITALPLFDTAVVICKRLRNGKSVLVGDRNHVGHRLGRLGFSPRLSLLIVAALQMALAAGTIHLRHADSTTALIVLGQSIAILVAMIVLETIRDHKPA